MLKKIVCALLIMSGLSAVDYEIQEIGTLNTKTSEPLAINIKGQILGWYNIDGTAQGKHYFVRDKQGDFHELPNKEIGTNSDINWRYLTDEGKAYGTFDGNANFSVLYVWDCHNGVVKLGNLPSKEIVTINNGGQVLIKSIAETENGRSMRRPVIWQNGQVTKLYGLEGEIGIESDESYGLDMNNKGEVCGSSVIYLSYKNDVYKQTHAVKWINGKITDLHNKVPKTAVTQATTINDLGDVVVNSQLIRIDGKQVGSNYSGVAKSSRNHFVRGHWVLDRDGNTMQPCVNINAKLSQDYNSLWMNCIHLIKINDLGEIIAVGSTIYGEQHAMLLSPIKSE